MRPKVTRKRGRPIGSTAWNKGLTKETDSYDFITPEIPQKKPPGERELSFGAFVCALIQISNYRR